MPFNLALPSKLKNAGWKVKIFDAELQIEEPHITIVFRGNLWRVSLRTHRFMDRSPPARNVSKDLMEFISDSWGLLESEWNRIHGDNPV